MIPFLVGCTAGAPGPPGRAPPSHGTTAHTGHAETAETGDTAEVEFPEWSCNGTLSLPRVYTGGPDAKFGGLSVFGTFARRYAIGDLDANGLPDLLVSEMLPYGEDLLTGNMCLHSPGDGGAFWIADPLAGGDLLEVAVRFPADIVGCPEHYNETNSYGSGLEITEHDYTGDGERELVIAGPEGSWLFSGTPVGTLSTADADLFLPGIFVVGPELDLDQDGDLEFAGPTTVHLDRPLPMVNSLLADVGYFGGFVDFDADGVPEIFGRTATAALVHVEAPITLDRVGAAEVLPTANPTYLDGTVLGPFGIGEDWWTYRTLGVVDPDLAGTPCYQPGPVLLVQGGNVDEASVQSRLSFAGRYQQNRVAPTVGRVGDFNGDGVMDFLLNDIHDILIVLGPIEPGLIHLEHAIRIPAGPGRRLATHQPDTVYDIDGDGRDDIIAGYSVVVPGVVPAELHIYLASSFLAGPYEFPTEPGPL